MSIPKPDSSTAAAVVRLTVPADPESLFVVRTVVAGIGAEADLTIDDLDDLSIAAEEATLTLMSHGAAEVELAATTVPGEVRITVSSDGDPSGWPPADLAASIAWRVLTGLADDVGLAAPNGRPGLSFRKRSGPR